MNEIVHMFVARPCAVFRVGLHWFEVVHSDGPCGLLVFTSERQYHQILPPLLTGILPEVWVGLVPADAANTGHRIAICAPIGAFVRELDASVMV
jgi:hypothetical protein